MKALKLLFYSLSVFLLLTSCVAEVIVEDAVIIEEPVITLDEALNSYEIWYVDIERTQGSGEIPFLQKAFTISFKNGFFYANNNLVGIGSNGNGFGVLAGVYDAYGSRLDIDHDLDGFYDLRVDQISANQIKIHDELTRTTYFLDGYQRNTFDYDKVFYDNIHYFLHEYEAWEKVFTSDFGALNEFDNENFLKFEYYGSGDNFKSSQDRSGTPVRDLFYDYIGYYQVNDIANDFYRKTLTLDYDYLGNEYFELIVINDNTIELFHPISGTVYRFAGRGYIQFKNAEEGKSPQQDKKRIKKADFIKLSI